MVRSWDIFWLNVIIVVNILDLFYFPHILEERWGGGYMVYSCNLGQVWCSMRFGHVNGWPEKVA